MENISILGKIDKLIENKRVLIVGPALSLYDDTRDLDLNKYDLVIKINNHWIKRKRGEEDHPLSKRTDMVFHCMNPSEISEGLFKRMKEENIFLISRSDIVSGGTKSDNQKKNSFDKKNENVKFDNYDCVTGNYFKQVIKEIGSNPTSGMLCIKFISDMNPELVTVTGFDFYKSLYFHDNNKKIRDARNRSDSMHSPSNELNYLKNNKLCNVEFIGITDTLIQGE
jgi:hypothetical protein